MPDGISWHEELMRKLEAAELEAKAEIEANRPKPEAPKVVKILDVTGDYGVAGHTVEYDGKRYVYLEEWTPNGSDADWYATDANGEIDGDPIDCPFDAGHFDVVKNVWVEGEFPDWSPIEDDRVAQYWNRYNTTVMPMIAAIKKEVFGE